MSGVLVLRANDRTWAKLCFEYSPQAEPTVVSVVTRDVSDDCNSFVVDGNAVWLRVSRIGHALAFHASTDGFRWRFVRHFTLGPVDSLAVGFHRNAARRRLCVHGIAIGSPSQIERGAFPWCSLRARLRLREARVEDAK